MLYADILLPLALSTYTYEVSAELQDLNIGESVQVPFGQRKHYVGIVWRLHNERPNFKNIKAINRRVVNSPRLLPIHIALWNWISDYYMCTLGEVMRAAIPTELKPNGFSIEEFDKDSYKRMKITYVTWGDSIRTIEDLTNTLNTMGRAKAQHSALSQLCSLANISDDTILDLNFNVPRRTLECSPAILKSLESRNIIHLFEREVSPEEYLKLPLGAELPILSEAQTSALTEIHDAHSTNEVALLHGVTGSGKTELYITLIDKHLRDGGDVLYLLPEIALTTQLIDRMRHYFGDRIVTYHSKHASRKKVENYLRINRHNGGELIIGVRSAIFLPIGNLSLIIVDEEHDSSFKQSDPAPRYHARDCAIVLAKKCNAQVVLGSATPSVESYVNASEGKYRLVNLTERYGSGELPTIIISDTIRASKRGERKAHFNKILLDSIVETIGEGDQVILFQNRRGFSPYIECTNCGWSSRCTNCNVTMTLHKMDARLKCHYCGSSASIPAMCPSCKIQAPQPMGFGTEKVEEELLKLLPTIRVARLDRDSARSEKEYNSIISSFSRGDVDVLIGTQMLTKGFDFSGVSLVGVLNADNMLNYPDFRASERAFQLMTQVSGRAGRTNNKGRVIIQTTQPDHPTIHYVATNDYDSMIRSELQERQEFAYPPYCRMMTLTLKHKDKRLLYDAAMIFGNESRKIFGGRILGPQPPSVDKIKREYMLCFMLKIERNLSYSKAKKLLMGVVEAMSKDSRYHTIISQCNIDPQ